MVKINFGQNMSLLPIIERQARQKHFFPNQFGWTQQDFVYKSNRHLIINVGFKL